MWVLSFSVGADNAADTFQGDSDPVLPTSLTQSLISTLPEVSLTVPA